MDAVSSEMRQRIQLTLSCRSLKDLDSFSKSDPYVEVYIRLRAEKNWTFLGKTEVLQNNLNPDFATPIEADYCFEREQLLRFMVYDDDQNGKKDFIGKCETTVGKIFGSQRQTFQSELTLDEGSSATRGKIIVRLDSVNVSNDELRFKFRCQLVPMKNMCCAGTNNPYYTISRARSLQNSSDFVRVFKSEQIHNNPQPVFNSVKVKSYKLCNGQKDLPLKIELFSFEEHGEDECYGQVVTTVDELARAKQLRIEGKKGGGELLIDSFLVVEMPSFADYLRSGWAINMSVSIDYTASNMDIVDPQSLHFQYGTQQLNQYEQAILSVGSVLEPYAFQQEFAVFGFGGKPLFAGSAQISHCFNLSGRPDPRIVGFRNIFHAYKQTIQQIDLAGPTKFSVFLETLLGYVKGMLQMQIYHVMLILTDGDIHDREQTTDLIIELSKYPVSLIIVGVGNEDFEIMDFLDSDNQVLRNSRGEVAKRDIVQFVRFKDFAPGNQAGLAEEVLKELPDQIVGYMMSHGVKPNKQEFAPC